MSVCQQAALRNDTSLVAGGHNRHQRPEQRKTMKAAGGDRKNLFVCREPANLYWCATVCENAIAQLAVSIGAPRPDRAVVSHGQTVALRSSNRYRLPSAGQRVHLHRCAAVCEGAVAKLAVSIVAPRPD